MQATARPSCLSISPTGQTAHHIFTLDGSNDADSCKGVPFLTLVDIVAHLWDQIDKNPNFGSVNKSFTAKLAKY